MGARLTRDWLIDSGSTIHLCNESQQSSLINKRAYTGPKLKVADGRTTMSSTVGDMDLHIMIDNKMVTIRLRGVLLVPGAGQNLVSVDLLMDSGFTVVFKKKSSGKAATISKKGRSFECVRTTGGSVLPICNQPVAAPTQPEVDNSVEMKKNSSYFIFVASEARTHWN